MFADKRYDSMIMYGTVICGCLVRLLQRKKSVFDEKENKENF